MKATWNGAVIAESDDTVVVERTHYFPRDSVKDEHLKTSDTETTCSWKGVANYYSLVVGEDENTDAAWYYADPKEKADNIRGRVAFWKGVEIIE